MADIDFPSIDQRGTGYVVELEDLPALEASSRDLPFLADDVVGDPVFDPRPFIPVVNQGSMGACVGNSGVLCLLLANFFCGGDMRMFSRMFAYLLAQKFSGYLGRDQGAAVVGMAYAAEKVGICLETTMPYPSRYSIKIPEAAYAEGKPHILKGHTALKSYDMAFTFLKARLGGIQIGIQLVQSVDLNRNGIIEELRGSSRGGHAMCWLGISPRKDKHGRNYLWGPNTWGKGWGNQGWAEWSPSVVDSICSRQTAIGFSNMEEYKPEQPNLHMLFA